jgi:chemotaxis protein CheX
VRVATAYVAEAERFDRGQFPAGMPMRTHCNHILERLISDACIELFLSCNLPVCRAPLPPGATQPEHFDVAGIVGFMTQHLCGNLVLASTFKTVAAARPTARNTRSPSPHSASDWLLVRDWAAELVNQLLGRLKSRLYLFGVDLHVRPPAALSGRALSVVAMKRMVLRPFIYQGGGHQVWVWLDADMTPSFELGAPRKGGALAAKEGERVLI